MAPPAGGDPLDQTELPTAGTAVSRVAKEIATHTPAVLVPVAIAADFVGLLQWFGTNDKTTIYTVLTISSVIAGLWIVVKYLAADRNTRASFLSSRRRIVALGSLVALAGVSIGILVFDPQHPATLEPPVAASGERKLEAAEGLDLDTGQYYDDQNMAGVDLSPSRTGVQIDAMTNGKPRFAVPTQVEGSKFDRCSQVPSTAWVKTLRVMQKSLEDLRTLRVS